MPPLLTGSGGIDLLLSVQVSDLHIHLYATGKRKLILEKEGSVAMLADKLKTSASDMVSHIKDMDMGSEGESDSTARCAERRKDPLSLFRKVALAVSILPRKVKKGMYSDLLLHMCLKQMYGLQYTGSKSDS